MENETRKKVRGDKQLLPHITIEDQKRLLEENRAEENKLKEELKEAREKEHKEYLKQLEDQRKAEQKKKEQQEQLTFESYPKGYCEPLNKEPSLTEEGLAVHPRTFVESFGVPMEKNNQYDVGASINDDIPYYRQKGVDKFDIMDKTRKTLKEGKQAYKNWYDNQLKEASFEKKMEKNGQTVDNNTKTD